MFRVVQSGFAVFGEGATREDAIADAAQWMEDDETGLKMTIEKVEDLIVNETGHAYGQFILVDESSQHFDTK